jgi:hypothetical protein
MAIKVLPFPPHRRPAATACCFRWAGGFEMKRKIARLCFAISACLGLSWLAGCDLFVSRGAEGQACFENGGCSGDLICVAGTCKTAAADGGDGGDRDAGPDGGDLSRDADGQTQDAGDEMADEGQDAGDPGQDAGDPGQDAGGDEGQDAGDPGIDGGDEDPGDVIHIYRSVGPSNTDPLVEGSQDNELTISGSGASFDLGLPDNVGLGDVIVYDSNDDSTYDALAFIHGRNSPTSYSVAASDGMDAVDTSGSTEYWVIYRAYTSLYNAVLSMDENAGIPVDYRDFDNQYGDKDLATSNKIWNIACYADAVDTAKARVEGWMTDADHYLKIFTPVSKGEVGVSQRHTGKWEQSGYMLEYELESDGGERVLNFSCSSHRCDVHIEGLRISKTSFNNWSGACVFIAGLTDARISKTLIRGTGTNGQGIHVSGSAAKLKLFNSVIFETGGDNGTSLFLDAAGTAHIYNVTLYNNNRGTYFSSGTTAPGVILKNVISYNNNSYCFFSIDYGEGSTNNSATDSTAISDSLANGHEQAVADVFVDAAGGDFHLSDQAIDCKDLGADLAGDPNITFSDDIDDQSRPAGLWDFGADEFVP